jgi:hypothetical protein
MYGKDTSSSVALVNTSSDEPSRSVVIIIFSSSMALEARACVFDEGERNKEQRFRNEDAKRERGRRHFESAFTKTSARMYLDAFASRDGIKTKDGVLRKVLV